MSIIEEGGFFSFKVYDSSGNSLQTLPSEELVKVHLAANDDCSSVVFSNTFLKTVQILKKNDAHEYETFRELPVQEKPVGQVSINPDGDIVVFPLLSTSISKVYKYSACVEDFEFVVDLEASEGEPVTTTITDYSILIGMENGVTDGRGYAYDEGVCDDFGKKVELTFNVLDSVSTATRSITHLHVSGDLLLASEKYSLTELYRITEAGLQSAADPFGEDIFTSDGDINAAAKCFVLTSHSKKAYIYKEVDGSYTLDTTIEMQSQVTSVDMSNIDCSVLLGHQDGSLSVHTPRDYNSPTVEATNEGFSVL